MGPEFQFYDEFYVERLSSGAVVLLPLPVIVCLSLPFIQHTCVGNQFCGFKSTVHENWPPVEFLSKRGRHITSVTANCC